MSDTSSNDPTSMEARVTQAGEAIGEHVKSATAATAAAAGHAQKVIEMLPRLPWQRPVRQEKCWAT
jgi:hypothetical protein